jgi:hypothetical protein
MNKFDGEQVGRGGHIERERLKPETLHFSKHDFL